MVRGRTRSIRGEAWEGPLIYDRYDTNSLNRKGNGYEQREEQRQHWFEGCTGVVQFETGEHADRPPGGQTAFIRRADQGALARRRACRHQEDIAAGTVKTPEDSAHCAEF